MRLDQFTVKAQDAITSAQTEAEKRDHPEVTPEHLVQTLLTQEGGVVPAALSTGAFLRSVPPLFRLGFDAASSLLVGHLDRQRIGPLDGSPFRRRCHHRRHQRRRPKGRRRMVGYKH